MSKFVIVNSFASIENIKKYSNYNLVGVEKGVEKILSLNLKVFKAISDFDTYPLSSFLGKVNEDDILLLPSKKDDSDTEYAIKYLIDNYEVDEIVILGSLSKRYDHSHALLLLLKKYYKYNISLVDEFNLITYYEKGEYSLLKHNYSFLGIFGFPNALISINNAEYNVTNFELDFVTTQAISNSFIDDKANLNVINGGVLVIRSSDKNV